MPLGNQIGSQVALVSNSLDFEPNERIEQLVGEDTVFLFLSSSRRGESRLTLAYLLIIVSNSLLISVRRAIPTENWSLAGDWRK